MRYILNIVPKTLLTRFMLIIIIPTLIGQVLAIFLFYDRHWYNVSYYTSNIITNEIKSLLDDHNKSYKNEPSDSMINYLNLSYQFYKNGILPKKQPKINEELGIFKNILDVSIDRKNRVRLNENGKIEVLFKLEDGLMKITFSSKLLMNPTTYIFVLWLIFLTIILLSISLIFSKNQIKSILALARAADEFGHGIKNVQRFKPSGATEIRKAGFAFLKMQDRIEKQIAKRTQLLAMISHDLCTPITRMKLQLELMENSEEKDGLQEDINSMQQMIASYLDFARGEGGEELQEISIKAWIQNLIQTKWLSNNIELIAKKEEINLCIKPLAFERAISNLITNSTKYSKRIKITISTKDSNVVIEIEDDGNGIKDEEKNLVFKPFYRSDKSRTIDNYANVGLGLAITREIILSHHGTISLGDSKDLGGLMVKITVPN
jgi:two-component system osmolarity sensor histidine kinase EnvZ